ncbi:hypothetical protein AB3N59_02670 [Leptospira sp. WS92.C1]
MKAALFKTWMGLILLSVFVLILNCGPICEVDSKFESPISQTKFFPCHQNQTTDDKPGCEWDIDSLIIIESDLNVQKLTLVLLPIHFSFYAASFSLDSPYPVQEFVSNRFRLRSNLTLNFSSVRLLI